jgi:hypothetical protein
MKKISSRKTTSIIEVNDRLARPARLEFLRKRMFGLLRETDERMTNTP